MWNYVKFKPRIRRSLRIGNDERSVSSRRKPTFETSHRQKSAEAKSEGETEGKILWGWTILTALVIVMAAHMLTAITSYLWQPVATFVSLSADSQPFPRIAVCPDFPFDVQELERYNAVRPYCAANWDQARRHFLDSLPGVWAEGGTDIRELWRTSAMNISEYITSDVNSETILTTNNVCYMLKPSGDGENALSLYGELPVDFSICFGRSVGHLWIMFPEKGFEPVMIQQDQVYTYSFTRKTSAMTVLTLSTLIMDRVKPCQPLPYRRSSCLHQCLLEIAVKALGCSLPYVNISNIPACRTQEQYANSVKYMVDTHTLTTLDTNDQCNKKCPDECHTQHYHISRINKVEQEYGGLSIKYLSDVYLHIREYISQSFSSLLSELGGIVGLYVGWSMLELGDLLNKSLDFMGVGVAGGMRHPLRGVVKPSFRLLCLMVAGVLWTERILKYVGTDHYYTHYGVESIRSQQFPSLTVCRWPPFNLSRLVDSGLLYDSDASCTHNGFYYRCFSGTITIRELPGVWARKTADEVWQESAWDLTDLVRSIQLDGRDIQIK